MRGLVLKAEKLFIFRVILGFGLVFACSQIMIPTYPVPVTMQTVAVVLLGLIYSKKEILAIWASYYTAGSVGIPVYYNFTSGLAKLFGPTAGYLMGFVVASLLISYLKEKFELSLKNFFHIAFLVFVGHVCIYSLGVLWLANIVAFDKAIYSGFVIFIIPGIIKTLILTTIIRLYNVKIN